MLGSLQKLFDPEGYAAKQRINLGVAVCLVVLYTLWRSIVEIQFMVMSETTTATILDGLHISYRDGDEDRRERLETGTSGPGEIQIDFLPGVGLARVHGSRNWTPFLVLLVAALVALVLLLPVIQEARDFAKGNNKRKRHRR